MNINKPWETPVYNAQVKSFTVAREYCKDFRTATPGDMAYKPPYCLRIVREYRTEEMQKFRDTIAAIVKQQRRSNYAQR